MNLQSYLSTEQITMSAFARLLGITPGMVSHYVSGRKPFSPKICIKIEKLTNGTVSRKDLRPADWHLIWPELENK